MKKILLVIIALLSLTTSQAQESSNDSSILMLTFSPTNLIAFNPTVRGGVEYWFRPNLRVEVEGGWLFANNWLQEEQRGSRFIVGFKYGPESKLNLILNADYRRIVQDRFGYAPQSNGSYFIAEETTNVRTRLGASIGLGQHFYTSDNNYAVEWSVSIGVGNRNRSNFLLENGSRQLREESNSPAGYLDLVFKFKFPVKRW